MAQALMKEGHELTKKNVRDLLTRADVVNLSLVSYAERIKTKIAWLKSELP